MNFSEKLLAKPGKKVDLNQFDPDACYGWNEPEEIKDRTAKNIRKLLDLQYKLYAEGRQSLLIVLQAMDAGGKDGVINNVIAPLNPQGCRCNSFKVPSNLEASHDFLWREHLVAPRKGEVVVFNRSHYEGVLVERVHGELSSKQLQNRFDLINDFEHLLYSNRTTVVKFYLHISKDEQLKRFGERLDDPKKHWKISENDYKEREYWEDYMLAFGDALANCSTKHAPWFIIPANNKDFRNLAVSEILLETLEKLDPRIPEATIDVAAMRRLYYGAAAETSLTKKEGSDNKIKKH